MYYCWTGLGRSCCLDNSDAVGQEIQLLSHLFSLLLLLFRYPHLVEKLVVMSCIHPVVFRQELTLGQMFRSWYMFFYQIPLLPEFVLQSKDFDLFEKIFRSKAGGLVNKDLFTDDDMEAVKYTFSQSGTMKAAINYYRALFQYQSDFSRTEVSAPVLVLWGNQDMALGEEMIDATQKYCGDIRIRKIANASHWLNQDVPDIVNKYMEIFFKENQQIEQHLEF